MQSYFGPVPGFGSTAETRPDQQNRKKKKKKRREKLSPLSSPLPSALLLRQTLASPAIVGLHLLSSPPLRKLPPSPPRTHLQWLPPSPSSFSSLSSNKIQFGSRRHGHRRPLCYQRRHQQSRHHAATVSSIESCRQQLPPLQLSPSSVATILDVITLLSLLFSEEQQPQTTLLTEPPSRSSSPLLQAAANDIVANVVTFFLLLFLLRHLLRAPPSTSALTSALLLSSALPRPTIDGSDSNSPHQAAGPPNSSRRGG